SGGRDEVGDITGVADPDILERLPFGGEIPLCPPELGTKGVPFAFLLVRARLIGSGGTGGRCEGAGSKRPRAGGRRWLHGIELFGRNGEMNGPHGRWTQPGLVFAV